MKFGLKQEHIDQINSVFKQFNAVEQVIIYGSRAIGNYHPGSDIDLCVIDTNLSFTELMKIETQLEELLLPYKIELAQKRSISNDQLVEHIERIGQIFYQRIANIGMIKPSN